MLVVKTLVVLNAQDTGLWYPIKTSFINETNEKSQFSKKKKAHKICSKEQLA
jgi:hypothetical protein